MHRLLDPGCCRLLAENNYCNTVAVVSAVACRANMQHIQHITVYTISWHHCGSDLVALTPQVVSFFGMSNAKDALKIKDELLDKALHGLSVGSGSQLSYMAPPSGTRLFSCSRRYAMPAHMHNSRDPAPPGWTKMIWKRSWSR